ncbi:hypothetical protein [Streptomyces sp. NPDC093093]|uniref:hypothetical protein n=1 Tax=Streptomyces sp. NPDC093093 TaxID=3366025 RepID=UPI0037F2F7F0
MQGGPARGTGIQRSAAVALLAADIRSSPGRRTTAFSGVADQRSTDNRAVICSFDFLAACTRAEADYDVHDLLPAALDELGLTFYSVDNEAGQEAAAQALSRHMLDGELTPREFTFRIHQRHGHGLPLTERLAELDDEYDILEYGDRTVDQVDAEVTAEARRLAAYPAVPADGFAQLMHTDRPASSR